METGRLTALCTVMSNWNGTIIGPGHSVHQNRIYSLRIRCGPNYPDSPPEVWFLTRINLPCVSQKDGKVGKRRGDAVAHTRLIGRTSSIYNQVQANLLPVLAQWKRHFTLETVLVELRK
jgi:ubiquitin-conjugating enzyme E2 variant